MAQILSRLQRQSDPYQMPNACSSRCSRMLWSVVSNAAERSSNVKTDTFPSSRASKRSLTILTRAAQYCALDDRQTELG